MEKCRAYRLLLIGYRGQVVTGVFEYTLREAMAQADAYNRLSADCGLWRAFVVPIVRPQWIEPIIGALCSKV